MRKIEESEDHKSALIQCAVEIKMKKSLEEIAKENERPLPVFLRVVFQRIIDKKIKI